MHFILLPLFQPFISILYAFCTVPPSPPYGLNAFAVDNSSISLEGTNEFNGYSSLVFVVISYSVDRYPEDGISVLTLSLNSSNSICRLHCLPTLSGLHPYSNYSINVSLTNAVGLTSDSSNIVVTTLSLSEFQLCNTMFYSLYYCIYCRTNVSFNHQNCVNHC